MSGKRRSLHAAAALRRLCGAAALLGLFAMHGLAAHGTAHAGHPMPSQAGIAASAPLTAGHHADPPIAGQVATDPAPSAAGDRWHDTGLLGLAALCLAALLVGAALLLRLGRGAAAAPADRSPTPRASGRPARARRDRDPPCLFALSVQRS